MSEEKAFLEALKEERESSESREVYADWLEEHGQGERAEYLRLEAEVRGFDFITGNPEREEKKARRDQLEEALEKKDAQWLAEVSRVARMPAKHPRPTGVGRAEPIPAKAPAPAPAPEPPITDLFGVPRPLDTRMRPIDPVKPSWGRKYLFEILVAVVLAFLLKDMTTKGVLMRMLEDIYIRGHF